MEFPRAARESRQEEHAAHAFSLLRRELMVIKATLRKEQEERHGALTEKLEALDLFRGETQSCLEEQSTLLHHILDLVKDDRTSHEELEVLSGMERTYDKLLSRVQEIENRVLAMEGYLVQVEHTAPTTQATPSGLPANTHKDEAVQTADEIQLGRQLWENATESQRQLVERMYDLGYPVSYREMSKELGKSVSTIKNHLNNLKSKGFLFQELSGPNGVKKYLLDPRVRTFMTLRLND